MFNLVRFDRFLTAGDFTHQNRQRFFLYGRFAQNSCLGKRHPDGMPSDKKINFENYKNIKHI